MLLVFLVLLSTCFIAYANGANDNFKGVSTLFGSGTTHYKNALIWANITTFLGAITAVFFAEKLLRTFSGKGLVPNEMAATEVFGIAVLLGAALTVFLATRLGIPISTTHSLMGGLLGAGFASVGFDLNFAALGKKFLIPLLVSPFLAFVITLFLYLFFTRMRKKLNVDSKTCLCVGQKEVEIPSHIALSEGALSQETIKTVGIEISDQEICDAKVSTVYSGNFLGISAQRILDSLHFLSGGAVCFARGVNDTPKIVALMIALEVSGLRVSSIMVAVFMLLGGIISIKRVAQTMSKKITGMNHGQGFTGNFVTAILVIFASKVGVPVSTTHVSCGSLFGIGVVSGRGNLKVILGILSAWFLTLPIAAFFAALTYQVLRFL